MKTAIRRWGNSLALRIPHAYAVEASLEEGSAINLVIERGRLVATPRKKKKYRLADLLGGMKEAQLHPEQWRDQPAGKEIW